MTDRTAGRIAEALCRLALDHYGPGARVVGRPAVIRRRRSVHLRTRVAVPGGGVDLVAKIPLWAEAPDLEAALEAGPQAAARSEFEALEAIAGMVERSGDTHLAAVRPVAYLKEINAVITEYLDSRPLGSLPAAARIAAAPALGRWLRRYHDEIGGASAGPFDPAGTFGRLEAALEGTPPGPLHDAVADLRIGAARLEGRQVRTARIHGDLGPSNVLVTTVGRVAVIDPKRVFGPAALDLAEPAVALRTGRIRLSAGWPAGGPDRFLASLVDAYGGVDPAFLALATGIVVLERWGDVERSAAAGARRLARFPARRVLAAEALRAATLQD